jgi:hypothetical protein
MNNLMTLESPTHAFVHPIARRDLLADEKDFEIDEQA